MYASTIILWYDGIRKDLVKSKRTGDRLLSVRFFQSRILSCKKNPISPFFDAVSAAKWHYEADLHPFSASPAKCSHAPCTRYRWSLIRSILSPMTQRIVRYFAQTTLFTDVIFFVHCNCSCIAKQAAWIFLVRQLHSDWLARVMSHHNVNIDQLGKKWAERPGSHNDYAT